MSITLNPPAGPWTIDDLDHVSGVDGRLEIHGGNLVIMSPATRWHSRVMRRLTNALEAQGLETEQEVSVRRGPSDTRVADVAVFAEPQIDADERAHWEPSALTVVIEIVSDSSDEADHVGKPRWYARAGIPQFWRVERSENAQDAVIFQYKLAKTSSGEAAYVESGVTTLSILESQAAQGSNL